jgi:hypothetical protein
MRRRPTILTSAPAFATAALTGGTTRGYSSIVHSASRPLAG